MQPPRLPPAACLLSGLGLCLGLIISILATIDVIEIPWDSTFWPALSAFGLVPLCVAAMIVSFTSLLRHRDGWSVLALVLGVIAVGVSILTTMLLLVIGVANNPV